MTVAIILLGVLCLAYANGANDNFKGVATLFGSGTTDYRGALLWATVATACGSITAIFLAEQLLKTFTGRGLVGAELAGESAYVSAVAMGAAITVLIATRVGLPISTTHSLIGALVGAGLAAGAGLQWSNLGAQFFLPLLVSPVIAVAFTMVAYRALHATRCRLGITEESCICIGSDVVEVVPLLNNEAALQRVKQLTTTIGETAHCRTQYSGQFWGIEAATLLDKLHFLSAGVVSYARGLNDTPKIAALLLLAPQLGKAGSTLMVAVLIACGGLISARRVAETMSRKITTMNHGQGFTANLITGLVVIGASRFGVPVSTTHVSCGSMFGLGAISQQAQWPMIGRILAAWMITLPLGAVLGAACYTVIGIL